MEKDTNNNRIDQTPTEDNKTQPEPISSELEGVESDTKHSMSDSDLIEKQPKVERDENGRLKKGSVLNPDGVRSAKNWDTYYWEAIKKIAEANGKTAEEFDIELGSKFIELARKGDIRALKDLFDRRFGKAKETHEVGGINGEPIKNEVKWIIQDGTDNS